MTKKVFYGWKADKDKVKNGVLLCNVNGVLRSGCRSNALLTGGICIFREECTYFDDEIDTVEFLFNEEELPDWVEPLVLDENNKQKIPNQFMDLYTMECVRDLIYWWFEFTGKKLSKERKDRIAKLVGLNFHKKRYYKFIDYGFNHPEYVKWLKKDVEKRRKERERMYDTRRASNTDSKR